MEDTVLALALLKTNWELKRRSYIDNFNLLTAEALRRSPQDPISAPQVQASLREHFGLSLPLNTVMTLLKRAARQGLVNIDHGVYRINRPAVSELRFNELQQSVLEVQESLFKNLARFAAEKFSLNWSSDDAERSIHAYLAEEALTVLMATTSRSYVPLPRHRSKGDKFVLASYVNSVVGTDSPQFEYLQIVAEGNMLARGIFLPEGAGAEGRKFDDTRLYFDTKFLLSTLGHAGTSLRAPNLELTKLLERAGARLACFAHTADEVKSVLIGCARGLRAGAASPGYGPVYDHFLGKGASESDVLLAAGRLDRDLHDLHIKIVPTPDFTSQHVIDERKLEEFIMARVRYANPNALRRDIASVAAVVRLRGDNHPRFLETCGALFVTTNRPLVEAVLEFTKVELPEEQVAAAILDSDLTNLVWLKQPSIAPDLPRRRLLATCYAALQPSDDFRRRFLDEIQRLAKTGKYTERDVFLLRNSLEARRIALDLTIGDEEAFAVGTIAEVLEILQLQIQREALAQAETERVRADEESARAEALRKEIAVHQERAIERYARREVRAEQLADIIASFIAGGTTVLLATIIYLSLLATTVPIFVRLLATLVVAIITLGTWMTSSFTVASLRERLAGRMMRPITRILGWIGGE